jgi:hypothetical protein
MTSPAVSWLFFKARAKRPYLCHTGRASNAEKQPTGPGPEGCVENGPAAALLLGYVAIQICALLAPCRRPILNATTSPLFTRRYTSSSEAAASAIFGKASTSCVSALYKSRNSSINRSRKEFNFNAVNLIAKVFASGGQRGFLDRGGLNTLDRKGRSNMETINEPTPGVSRPRA